jgi:hypothetical protein
MRSQMVMSFIHKRYQNMWKNWDNQVTSPTEAKDFSSSICVQTSSGAHPASYSMGTGTLSWG